MLVLGNKATFPFPGYRHFCWTGLCTQIPRTMLDGLWSFLLVPFLPVWAFSLPFSFVTLVFLSGRLTVGNIPLCSACQWGKFAVLKGFYWFQHYLDTSFGKIDYLARQLPYQTFFPWIPRVGKGRFRSSCVEQLVFSCRQSCLSRSCISGTCPSVLTTLCSFILIR